MKIKCVIIDDEPLAIDLIESHISQLPYLEVVATFKNAIVAFEFIKTNRVDLLFLDIQMPMLSGISFLKSIRVSPKVIITTAYREYAIEGYELNVVDYLLKPITFERFLKAVDKFSECSPIQPQAEETNYLATSGPEFIFVKADKKHIKINFEDILYVESSKDYLKIRTPESFIVIKEKISEFVNNLPEPHFIRVHRSYIVNSRKITAYTNYDIEISDIEIPIGGIYKQHVFKILQK